MKILIWILIAVFSFLAGFFIVQYLVQSPSEIALYTVLLCLSVGASVFVLGWRRIEFRGRKMIFVSLMVVVFLFSGYASANAVFLGREEERELPAVTRTDGGDGHTAILYFTHGEPPAYSSMPWIETIKELDRASVPFVPWILRPLFFNALRTEYMTAGGSPHNALHEIFIDNLRRAMPEDEENGTKFYLAFLDSNPRPDEMAINAINDGASAIVVLPVFVTESTHTVAGQEMVASVQPEKYNIKVHYADPLWNSDSLQKVFVERAKELSEGLDRTKVGILLVGHGQPTEWERLYPAQNQQEEWYREAIRSKLVAQGFSLENVALGWMEFQNPTITDSVKELGERNVEKILVFSVSLSARSIHSEIEVPAAVEEAKLPDSIPVVYVGQYGDHPLAIQAMIEKIDACR